MEHKQVIVVRSDLKLPKGKLAAQVAHASVDAVLKSEKRKVMEWKNKGMKKIVVKVESLSELKKIMAEADRAGLVTALITDAGHTVVEPGTVTCLGIGPDDEIRIDEVTGKLKMA